MGTAVRCVTLFPGLSKHQEVFTIINISWTELDDIPDQGGDLYGLSSSKVSFFLNQNVLSFLPSYVLNTALL